MAVKPPQADEVNVVVIETGSSYTRAGFSGDSLPKYVVPTAYGKDGNGDYYFDEEGVSTPLAGKEIYNPMNDGVIQDFEAISRLWKYIYSEKLHMDPSEAPLLIPEQTWNPVINKQRTLETVFEELQVPIFSLVKAPLCAAYESARANALVIDIGGAVASVTPVVDGAIINKGAMHSRLAGDFINLQILTYLQSRNIQLTPSYLIKKKSILDPGQLANPELYKLEGITESFHAYQVANLIHEFKETASQISDVPLSAQSPLARIARTFEFPDGFNLMFGAERLATTEPLFRPGEFSQPGITLPDDGSAMGLGELIYNSVSRSDINQDMIAPLVSNIIISGGGSLLQGLTIRIENDMSHMLPNFNPRFFIPPNYLERKSVTWAGASILASLGSFDQQSWVTKEEYEEHGSKLAEKRFK
jgi:actin-related protein 4